MNQSWQPIETIPTELCTQPDMTKDWPQVLVFSALGFYSVAGVSRNDDGTYEATGFADGLPFTDCTHSIIHIPKPTHWMSLPRTPSGVAPNVGIEEG
jgi:hypothetical protein